MAYPDFSRGVVAEIRARAAAMKPLMAPWSIRKKNNISTLWERPISTCDAASPAMALRTINLRPYRSPRCPQIGTIRNETKNGPA